MSFDNSHHSTYMKMLMWKDYLLNNNFIKSLSYARKETLNIKYGLKHAAIATHIQ